VTVPIYPLAPAHQCPETVEFVKRAYDKFAAGLQPEDQVVMGDSAGAGLALDRRDPYLALTGLNEAARLYSGPLPRTDPRLSPISGDLTGLGNLTTYIGTRDVLLTDARRLRTLCTEQGVPLGYHEFEDMIHAWMIAAIPEATRVVEEIAHLVDRR
jgi:acetyl esterase/lipase